MLHDAHHSIGGTTGAGAQTPGAGSEPTAAYCGFLEVQRALEGNGFDSLMTRAQVSETDNNKWLYAIDGQWSRFEDSQGKS